MGSATDHRDEPAQYAAPRCATARGHAMCKDSRGVSKTNIWRLTYEMGAVAASLDFILSGS
jgi:hypothetical protein